MSGYAMAHALCINCRGAFSFNPHAVPSIRVKGGIDEKVKAGFKKFSPRLRKHTLHKIKRK